jgi:hypothetical protein
MSGRLRTRGWRSAPPIWQGSHCFKGLGAKNGPFARWQLRRRAVGAAAPILSLRSEFGFPWRPRFEGQKASKRGWKSLDFLGFSRPNRAFSMGYEGSSRKKFSGLPLPDSEAEAGRRGFKKTGNRCALLPQDRGQSGRCSLRVKQLQSFDAAHFSLLSVAAVAARQRRLAPPRGRGLTRCGLHGWRRKGPDRDAAIAASPASPFPWTPFCAFGAVFDPHASRQTLSDLRPVGQSSG